MTNKITVSTNSKKISLDIENPDIVFWQIVGLLQPKPISQKPVTEPKSEVIPPVAAPVVYVAPEQMKHRGKGFLYIKCENCGKAKGFNTKYDIDRFYCKDCDTTTVFTDPLVHVRFNCECGSNFRYHTNIADDMFDINCLDCQSPVTVEYNGKAKEYRGV